jgi:hypothetical protein
VQPIAGREAPAVSPIPGPAPVAGSPRQTGVSSGAASPAAVPREAGASAPVFVQGSLWAAQIGAISPRAFVLVVGGQAFDVAGQPPAPEGTPLLVRAHTEDGLPVFEVIPTGRPARAAEALRVALGHLLRRAVGSDATALPPSPPGLRAGADLADALATAIRERMAEPSSAVAEYLLRGILRLAFPVTTTDTAATWHLEIDPHAVATEPPDHHAASVALFATLPTFGPVEARLLLSRDSLSVRVVLASAEAATRVDEQRGVLRAALMELGFRTVSVAAVASPAQLARDRATDAVPHEPPPAGGLLDVRA